MRKSRVSYTDINRCEVYMQNLKLFTLELEFLKMELEDKKKINDEIRFMDIALALYDSFVGGRGTRIIATKKLKNRRVTMEFGNAQVARDVLGVQLRHLQAVCSGTKSTCKGWRCKRIKYEKHHFIKESKMSKPRLFPWTRKQDWYSNIDDMY